MPGTAAPARTYQDLLQNEYDEALYDHYFTAQIGVVSAKGKLKEMTSAWLTWGREHGYEY